MSVARRSRRPGKALQGNAVDLRFFDRINRIKKYSTNPVNPVILSKKLSRRYNRP